MSNSAADLARRLKRIELQGTTLGSAQQLTNSTVGDTDDQSVAIADVVTESATTNDAVPDLQDDAASTSDYAVALSATVEASNAELDARFEGAAIDLSVATDEINESMGEIRDAFGQTVEGLSGDVSKAITAAGTATESAEYARDLAQQSAEAVGAATKAAADATARALAAAGIAADKGKIYTQPAPPPVDGNGLWLDSDDGNKPYRGVDLGLLNRPVNFLAGNADFRNGIAGYYGENVIDVSQPEGTYLRAVTRDGQQQSFVIQNTPKNADLTLVIRARRVQDTRVNVYGAVGTSAVAPNPQQPVPFDFSDVFVTQYADITTTDQGNLYLAMFSAGAQPGGGVDIAGLMLVPGKGYRGPFDNGRTDRRNLALHPKADDGTTAYQYTNGTVNDSIIESSAERAHSGTRSIKLTGGSGVNEGVAGGGIAVPKGSRVTFSAWVYVPSDNGIKHPVLLCWGRNFDNVEIPERDQWVRKSITTDARDDGTVVIYLYDGATESGGNHGRVMWTDEWLVEVADQPGPYLDGSMLGVVWDGVPYQSTSHYAGPAWIPVQDQAIVLAAKSAADAGAAADAAGKAAQGAQGTADQATRDAATAKAAAAAAQTAADGANTAALNAAGLAADKGKVIVQVTAPSGANADPRNLWIDITTNASGVPKNTPNRYNPATSKWEPITDQKVIDAAAAAATAQSTASSAASAAQAAQGTADQAKTAAANAQGTADQAKSAAATAQSAADNANTQALSAAGIANGKGKVLYQASAPTGANAAATNLWIRTTDNTPWTYNGSTWVQVTDVTATNAAAAAAAANTAAQNAAAAAQAAQATADGRPLILFSANGPSGTAPTGSTWFQVNTAQSVVGQWQQTGTPGSPVWTARPITSDVIANLDVGKLTAGNAAIADLVAQKIAASTANFQTVNVSNLFVTSGATMQQAVIDYLFAKVVQAKKITADMIDVNTLNGVNLQGVSITGGSFTTVGYGSSAPYISMQGTTIAFTKANEKTPSDGPYTAFLQQNVDSGTYGQIGALELRSNQSGANSGSFLLSVGGYDADYYRRDLVVDRANVQDLLIKRRDGAPASFQVFGEMGSRTVSTGAVSATSATVTGDVTAAAHRSAATPTATAPMGVTGRASAATDGSGMQVIPHSLGVTPSNVLLTIFGPSSANAFAVRVVSMTASSFTVQYHYNDASWTNQNVATRGVSWFAML
jgi:hypothetical protein